MILALPAVIFLHIQYLVSYSTHQGRNILRKRYYILYLSLALIFIFFLPLVLEIQMTL